MHIELDIKLTLHYISLYSFAHQVVIEVDLQPTHVTHIYVYLQRTLRTIFFIFPWVFQFRFFLFILSLFVSIRFDFDSQAISPPAHDDSFFYIRYPTGLTNDKKQYSARGLNSIADAITTTSTTIESKSIKPTNEGATNMVQHTEPCKKFLNNKDRGKHFPPKFK